MKVILIQDVKKLGEKGKILDVSVGYARNFLIPQGLAEEATKTKIKEIEEKNVREEKKKTHEKKQADTIKARLDGKSIKIQVKTGAGDKLFGAVTAKEISDILQKEFGVSIDKKKIEIPEPIKHIGEHTVRLKIYPAVQAEVKLIVASK